MTTLIAWTSHDHRKFSALHVASDSRITWGSSAKRWDAGRKVFSSTSTPDILAYSGDVVFPALVLSQLISAADAGMLFGDVSSALERNSIVFEALKTSFNRRHNAPDHKFVVLHASRDEEKAQVVPRLWKISFDPQNSAWKNQEIPLNNAAGVAVVIGSGKNSTEAELRKWKESDIGGTSRSIYAAFCKSILAATDPLSGGSPQIASLYPRGVAVTAGAVHEGTLHLHGLPINTTSVSDKIEWFDSLFQRIDPKTLCVRSGATRHAKPKFE